MAFSDYTTPDEVRSLLGASSKEVKDAVITTNANLLLLLEKLDGIDAGVRAAYEEARMAEPMSELQARFTMQVQAFAGYTVAMAMIPAMGGLAPKRITDGKSEVERFDNPFAALEPGLRANCDTILKSLKRVYSALTGNVTTSAPARTMVANSPLGTDPITG